MGKTSGPRRKDMIPKTAAKLQFCLSDKDLDGLIPVEKRNPFSAKAAPMKLYQISELQELAVRKYGGEVQLEAERLKRTERRGQLATTKQGSLLDSFLSPPGAPAAATQEGGQPEPPARLSNLRERVHIVKCASQSITPSGMFAQVDSAEATQRVVLYWMKAALRGHHNPALDIARAEALQRGLELVIAAPLLVDYAYASARRVKFQLEGLRDTQQELKGQGLPLLVHIPTTEADEKGWMALKTLVDAAVLVITEDMPVPPDTAWLERLCEEAPPDTEVWVVDCACVFPMRKVGRAYERASAFRSATEAGRKLRIGPAGPYPSSPDLSSLNDGTDGSKSTAALLNGPCWLPWQPLDLSQIDIGKEVKSNSLLDQSASPVTHILGGSRAGYQRWDQFRQTGGLRSYSSTRNNAMNRNGVSRLSAYHHFGMISPFKVALDATQEASYSSRKFLDEFLTWRELSYAFCCNRRPKELHSLAALPKWARATLEARSDDQRDIMSRESLEAGQTGDEFWDASQRQLAATGELHNNVRMTWGKAFLPWCATPEAALCEALHVNHKFALDGCDPCSYGGILWCFGQFDGPKGAATTPVFGSVRKRPTASHARRMSPAQYQALPV